MKLYKTVSSFSCFLLALASSWTHAQSAFSLEESVQYALKNSSQIKLNQLNLVDADAQLIEYKSIGYPKVSGSVDYSHYFAIPSTVIPDFLSPVVDDRLVNYNLITQNQKTLQDQADFLQSLDKLIPFHLVPDWILYYMILLFYLD